MSALAFTWLGHGTFLFRSPGGKRILVDPWLTANPSCPEQFRKIRELDLVLITHGHEDHVGDAVVVSRASDAQVIAPYELAVWLQQKGLRKVTGMNQGGTIAALGLSITMVPAVHSSSLVEDGRIVCVGEPCGYVIRFEEGPTIYFAGDTAVFGDMRLIADLYHPEMAFLPIGDSYTMGPEQAAKACELLAIRQVVPMHYATFPALTGTPQQLRALVEPRGIHVIELQPGETAT